MAIFSLLTTNLSANDKRFCKMVWTNLMKDLFPSFNNRNVVEEVRFGLWMPVWKSTSPVAMKFTAKDTCLASSEDCGLIYWYEIVREFSRKEYSKRTDAVMYAKQLFEYLEKSNELVFSALQFIERTQGIHHSEDFSGCHSVNHVIQRYKERMGCDISYRDISTMKKMILTNRANFEFGGNSRDIYTITYQGNTFLAVYDRNTEYVCTVMPHEWLIRVCANSAVYKDYGWYFSRDIADAA